ncbi:hypothetical protein P3S67_004971 [Capsicum chacoense]
MDRVLSQRHATSLTIAKIVKRKYLNLKSSFTPAEIVDEMRNIHGIRMSYKKAYRAKEKTIELVRGSLREAYAKLPAYLYMVNTINPGPYTRLHKTEGNHFMYTFVALNASIKGWEYCMPTTVVDGTFLKLAYQGTMFRASVLDAAGKILSLAYSIMDSENDTLWKWFLNMFKVAYGEKENISIVSDRHKSILKTAAKSLNSVNREARELPVKKLLQFIMELVMKWNNENRISAQTVFTKSGNKYNTIRREDIILSDKMKVIASTNHVYVVIDETQKRSTVCMHEKKCSCL